jgi:hypothetical protein
MRCSLSATWRGRSWTGAASSTAGQGESAALAGGARSSGFPLAWIERERRLRCGGQTSQGEWEAGFAITSLPTPGAEATCPQRCEAALGALRIEWTESAPSSSSWQTDVPDEMALVSERTVLTGAMLVWYIAESSCCLQSRIA